MYSAKNITYRKLTGRRVAGCTRSGCSAYETALNYNIKGLKMNDALRIINKCKTMYPELDFTNITILSKADMALRIGSKAGGVFYGRSVGIYVGFDKDHKNIIELSRFMGTVLHEALHREDDRLHGNTNHGLNFQKLCIKYGLDPIRETSHDDTVTEHIYPVNETDYKKYRHEWGDVRDPDCGFDDDEVCWRLREKHDKTYDRKCPAYKRHFDAVSGIARIRNRDRERMLANLDRLQQRVTVKK